MTEKQLQEQFDEMLELLSYSVEEPAGRGAGYGFFGDDVDEAFKIFKNSHKELQERIEQLELHLDLMRQSLNDMKNFI